MEPANVLLLESKHCDHVNAIANALVQRGAKPVIFDTRRFPSDCSITYEPAGEILLRIDKHRYLLSDFRSAYWRTHFGVTPRTTGCPDIDRLSWQDSESLLHCMLSTGGPRWFNSYQAWAAHKLKPIQLTKVAALGIPIPATCHTNDPDIATRFYKKHGNLIHKPVFGGSETQRVTPPLMSNERLPKVFSHSPVTLQACVEGTNLRTFVIGDTVLSFEIRATTIDFRTDPNHLVEEQTVTPQVREWSRSICHELGMNWTAIDWRLNKHGNPVFLEANPSPMFVGLVRRLNVDIPGLLADELMK